MCVARFQFGGQCGRVLSLFRLMLLCLALVPIPMPANTPRDDIQLKDSDPLCPTCCYWRCARYLGWKCVRVPPLSVVPTAAPLCSDLDAYLEVPDFQV